MMLVLSTLLPVASLAMPQLDGRFLRELTRGTATGFSAAELFLDPEGVVLECRILGDRLSEERKAQLCARVIGKDAGDGATGPDGTRVHGVIAGGVTRSINGPPRTPTSPELAVADLEVIVSRLSSGETSQNVNFVAFIGGDGIVQQCRPYFGDNMDLVEIGCIQSTGHNFPIKTGIDGEPVGYVDTISVDFTVEQSQP